MSEKDIKTRKKSEKNRLKRLLKSAGVEDWTLKLLDPVMENTAWMCIKLEDSMEDLQEEKITCEYDNGGGQTGTRQNPAFQAYEQLWKSYMAGMSQIMAAADVKEDKKSARLKPVSVIAMVKKEKKEA